MKAVRSPKRCKPWYYLDRTKVTITVVIIGCAHNNRKSHTRFRLAPTLMTLEDDLERPKRPSRGNKIVLRSPPKNSNEDRHILSAEKCRPMMVVSKKYTVYADMYRLYKHRNNAA